MKQNQCFKRLRKKLDNRNLDKVYSKFQKKFKQDIRDDLEHIDERAVDLKKGKPIEPIKDFRNYFNDNFTFNHKSYSVNKDSLKELKKTYKDIISVIHNDCAMKKPQFINDMMRKKGTEKIVEIIQKKFKLIQ